MNERGSALAEALVVTAIVGIVWLAAAGVLGQVPSQAASWEEASAMRQRLRVIETRVGRITASAGSIGVEVDGREVRIPSVWPRRLGWSRPGGAAEVSDAAVTFVSRTDARRVLTLTSALAAGGGEAHVSSRAGCGSAPVCDLDEDDVLLAVAAGGACGLYRVESAGSTLRLAALMQQGAAHFDPGSALVPVRIDVISFDPDERAIRRYDGYRSDNIMADGVRAMSLDWAHWSAALADGPFIGTGPLAYDVDQLALRGVRMAIDLVEAPSADATRRITLGWGLRAWR